MSRCLTIHLTGVNARPQPPRKPENFDPRRFAGVSDRSNSDHPAVPDHVQTQEMPQLKTHLTFTSDSQQTSLRRAVNLEKPSGARSARRRLIDKGDPGNDYRWRGSERALSITRPLHPRDRGLEARTVNSCVIWITVGCGRSLSGQKCHPKDILTKMIPPEE